MPHQLIVDLKEGAKVAQYFLVRRAESGKTGAGKPYLDLVLGDKSATIKAKVWSEVLAKCPGPFAVGDYVGIQGQVSSYKDELQITAQYISTVDALRARGKELKDFDPELLHLATPYDRQQLWQELRQLAETHLSPPLQELVLRLLDKYRQDLLVCPAAYQLHHAYLGGLLEHTWFVARHTVASLTIYPDLNHDLALAGAILHDLGKVKELAHRQAPEYTVPGRLLGHIVLGWEMLREEARDMNFPDPNLLMELEHIILSHHGILEFGSPRRPKTKEAFLVFYLDDLDAKLKMVEQHLQADTGDRDFTSYHRVLERYLYKGYKGGEGPSPATTLDPTPEE